MISQDGYYNYHLYNKKKLNIHHFFSGSLPKFDPSLKDPWSNLKTGALTYLMRSSVRSSGVRFNMRLVSSDSLCYKTTSYTQLFIKKEVQCHRHTHSNILTRNRSEGTEISSHGQAMASYGSFTLGHDFVFQIFCFMCALIGFEVSLYLHCCVK